MQLEYIYPTYKGSIMYFSYLTTLMHSGGERDYC